MSNMIWFIAGIAVVSYGLVPQDFLPGIVKAIVAFVQGATS